MFNVGDKVLFGRSHGEKTAGTIVKVNRAKYKIRQDEARGTMRDYPVGTVWTVPFNLAWPATGTASTPNTTPQIVPTLVTNLMVKSTFKIGDRVSFIGRRGMKVTGTVKSINIKTVTLVDCDDGGPGWRVSPGKLSLSTTPVTSTPAPVTATFTVGQPVTFEAYSWATKGTATVSGVVTLTRPGEVEVYSTETPRHTQVLPTSKVTAYKGKRTPDTLMAAFASVHSSLEPENLTCDGERSRSECNRVAASLNRALRALAIENGRMIDSSEAFRFEMTKRGQGALADKLFGASR